MAISNWGSGVGWLSGQPASLYSMCPSPPSPSRSTPSQQSGNFTSIRNDDPPVHAGGSTLRLGPVPHDHDTMSVGCGLSAVASPPMIIRPGGYGSTDAG